MSLVPYKEGSVILDDPRSRSLVIVHPSNGSLEFFQQVFDLENAASGSSWDQKTTAAIASFVCPQCGTEFNPAVGVASPVDEESIQEDESMKELPVARSIGSRSDLPRKYFKLLESSHRHYYLDQGRATLGPQHQYFIPDSLFIPGYYRKFFKTLSLLGNGARGSVYKVVHKIGDIDLGIFALKKIPIGNDMEWFQKCIREVKALSSLTHRSVNLITYNHVWLEMNTACGLLRTLDGREPDAMEDIPCIFILQQYCSGGNLEDYILKDVFHKFQDLQSPEERKKRFLYKRKHPNESLGLSTGQILSITKDIAIGLQELHDIGLIHRDLKPSNCLLLEENTKKSVIQEYNPTIVIGDLGECQIDGESRTATGATGTLEFTAPEVIIPGTGHHKPTNYNEYTFASDMYSLGMICYFIVFGELPFKSQLEIGELKQNIMMFTLDKNALMEMHNERNLKPIDSRIFELMELLLSQNVNERLTAAEVVTMIESISESTAEEKSEKEACSNEIAILHEDEVVPSKDDLLEKHSIEYVDPSAERSSSIAKRSKLAHSKKILCVTINLALTAFTISSSNDMSLVCYISLVLFGMSVTSSLKDQKWFLAIFGCLALRHQWIRFHK